MNSLNILVRSSSSSLPTLSLPGSSTSSNEKTSEPDFNQVKSEAEEHRGDDGQESIDLDDEKTPLLEKEEHGHGSGSGGGGDDDDDNDARQSSASRSARKGWKVHHRIAEFVINSVKIVIATITAPGRYLVACFYDDDGHFSTFMPLRKFGSAMTFKSRRRAAAMPVPSTSSQTSSSSSFSSRQQQPHEKGAFLEPQKTKGHRRKPSSSAISVASTSSSISDDDIGGEKDKTDEDTPAKHTRSHSVKDGSDQKRSSIRIQVQEESLRRRTRGSIRRRDLAALTTEDVASALKSPPAPHVSKQQQQQLTKYPRTPAAPRPLVPRRQPSYSLAYSAEPSRKTLIIDLDETLIHSMAKGGRMSQGHMVEVRLGGPVAGPGGVSIGNGVPILYFVHERPGCHEFLRKVCRWYNLVVFTASVQEYADPVIDWLERERKYFSKRYYRQHCTFRNGAYIKDLAQVEPDLSKVMILDNSPMSYVFHEDNAIPIEGWISDPTDNDLLHLVPLLEGLQYVTDVRALLALRQGQAQQA